jgi:3alpha(or 20beta)-hydroxysteroid dehydrogenase
VGKLDGRVALVTGAARGQGETEARLLVAEGAAVVLADVLDDAGAALAEELGDTTRFVHLDVSRPEEWNTAMESVASTFGRLDVLVNNAGTLATGPMEDMAPEEYLRVIHVNQFGCWLGMRAAVAPMRSSGGGAIVNTSSIAGTTGMANLSAYSASKWAVRGMTRCAALELAPWRIRVNAVLPGAVDTAMAIGSRLPPEEKAARYANQPVPRIGRTDEVASLVLYLVSDEAAFVTGADFVIDGGSIAGNATLSAD